VKLNVGVDEDMVLKIELVAETVDVGWPALVELADVGVNG